MKTVVGTYDNLQTAYATVNDLISAGYSRNDISVVANDTNDEYGRHVEANTVDANDDVAAGVGIGAAIGGLGGLLVGLGTLAIPGVGPVIAAGPLLAALTGAGVGAVTGGIVGALVDMGIPDEEAHIYSEGLRRGHVLVIAQVPDASANAVTTIMERPGLVDIRRQADSWRTSGWKRFDADRNTMTTSQRM
jgi:Heat induced stress protein YflT